MLYVRARLADRRGQMERSAASTEWNPETMCVEVPLHCSCSNAHKQTATRKRKRRPHRPLSTKCVRLLCTSSASHLCPSASLGPPYRLMWRDLKWRSPLLTSITPTALMIV